MVVSGKDDDRCPKAFVFLVTRKSRHRDGPRMRLRTDQVESFQYGQIRRLRDWSRWCRKEYEAVPKPQDPDRFYDAAMRQRLLKAVSTPLLDERIRNDLQLHKGLIEGCS